MARVELAADVLDDFDRLLEHMDRFKIPDPAERIGEIFRRSISWLIVRSSGDQSGAVSVLTIRSQREGVCKS